MINTTVWMDIIQLKEVIIFLVLLVTSLVSTESDCNRIHLTGATQQPATEGYYEWFNYCFEVPSYRHEDKGEGDSRFYYLYFYGPNPAGWTGWQVGKSVCSNSEPILKVDDNSADPLLIEETWRERVEGTDNFFDNPDIKLDCEERLPPGVVVGIFISVIVASTAIVILIIIVVLKVVYSKRNNESGAGTYNTDTDQRRISLTPPQSVCSAIEPSFIVPPPYSSNDQLSSIIAPNTSTLSIPSIAVPRNSYLDVSLSSAGNPPSYNDVIEEKLKREYEQMCTGSTWQGPNMDIPFYENHTESQTQDSSFAANETDNAFTEDSQGTHPAASEQYYGNNVSDNTTRSDDYRKNLNVLTPEGPVTNMRRPSNTPSTSSRRTRGHDDSLDSFAMNRTCDW